jgi:hypothetical protein
MGHDVTLLASGDSGTSARLVACAPRALRSTRVKDTLPHMLRDSEAATAPVLAPGVVSLAASSRRTLKHGDSFAVFDEFGGDGGVRAFRAAAGLPRPRGRRRLLHHHPAPPAPAAVPRLALGAGLRIGESRLDLMYRRHDSSVAVNLVKREGDAASKSSSRSCPSSSPSTPTSRSKC